jgi:hypothetical protein
MIYLADYLKKAHTESVSRIEYRTKSELLTTAYFFTLPRDEKMLDAEAFATLFMVQLCYFEEWSYKALDKEDFVLIEQNHLKPFIQAEVQSTTLETVEKINSITALCVAELESGIYKNGLPSSHTPLNAEEIISSTLYFDKWNHFEALLKTKTEYLFFSWATGA